MWKRKDKSKCNIINIIINQSIILHLILWDNFLKSTPFGSGNEAVYILCDLNPCCIYCRRAMWSALPQQRGRERHGRDGGVRGRWPERQRRRRLPARAGRGACHHRRPPQPVRPAPQVAARVPRARPIGRMLSTCQKEASDVSAITYFLSFFRASCRARDSPSNRLPVALYLLESRPHKPEQYLGQQAKGS